MFLRLIFYLLVCFTTGTYIKTYYIQQSIVGLNEKIRSFEEKLVKSNTVASGLISTPAGSSSYSIFSKEKTLYSQYALRELVLNQIETDRFYAIYTVTCINSSKKRLSTEELKKFVALLKERTYRRFSRIIEDVLEAYVSTSASDFRITRKRLFSTLLECIIAIDKQQITNESVEKLVKMWMDVNDIVFKKALTKVKEEALKESIKTSLLVEAFVNKLVF